MAHLQLHSEIAPQGALPPAAAAPTRLQHLPVAFFSVVMGLAGLGLAWSRAERALGLAVGLGKPLLLCAGAVFVLLVLAYGAKAIRHGAQVAAEFRHPVRSSFFPAISISLLLLSIGVRDTGAELARFLWLAGTALHLTFTLAAMNRWIHHAGIQVAHLNPAWFIPVVGNVLVPITGVTLYPPEVSWFFFSVGIVLWLVLLTLVLNRLFFHEPLPERLQATLAILVAPPAVGTVAYLALNAQVDAIAHALYSMALFFTLLLATRGPRFLRARFHLSAWAFSFPLAAVTIASFAMAQRTGAWGYAVLGLLLLSVASVVIAGLVVRTFVAIARREICVEE